MSLMSLFVYIVCEIMFFLFLFMFILVWILTPFMGYMYVFFTKG